MRQKIMNARAGVIGTSKSAACAAVVIKQTDPETAFAS
jgi:hypothetical protein